MGPALDNSMKLPLRRTLVRLGRKAAFIEAEINQIFASK